MERTMGTDESVGDPFDRLAKRLNEAECELAPGEVPTWDELDELGRQFYRSLGRRLLCDAALVREALAHDDAIRRDVKLAQDVKVHRP